MKSEEALRARLRFLRRKHGKEPNAYEYADTHARIEELEDILNNKPCEICRRFAAGFEANFFGSVDSVDLHNGKELIKQMKNDASRGKRILKQISEHIADYHV